MPVKAENTDRVVGILRARSYLIEYKRNPNLRLRGVIKPPYLVRKDAKIDDLLTDMRQHKLQVAMVLDDQKKVVGLVTIEDILEELVGEIFDEEDIVDQNFQALGGDYYRVNTHMLVGTLYERAGMGKAPRGLVSRPIITLVLETLGRMPEQEESFLYDHLEITVDTVEDGRPTFVVVHFLDDEALAERLASNEEKEVDA